MAAVVGESDSVLRALEDQFPGVQLNVIDGGIEATGGDSAAAAKQVQASLVIARRGQQVRAAGKLGGNRPAMGTGAPILVARGRPIRAVTPGQKRYVQAMDEHTIVFGIGPAGTGKTYLAMAKAVRALLDHEVERIILTRPAVEAGERLGFLPGTLNEKIDPYLRPLFDAMGEMLDPDTVPKLLETGVIEVAPLAYMRGRTLNDSYVILDEAQNTTREQMKMFLTRLGFGSRMVVTGDATQIDLPTGSSGLAQVSRILGNIEDIAFCEFTHEDVVRHELVAKIVDAYGAYDEKRNSAPQKRDRR